MPVRPGGAQSSIGLFFVPTRVFRRIVLIVLITIVAVQDLSADGPTLLGTVRDRHRGQPVSSASIQVFDRHGILLGTTLTDSQGKWHFTIPLTKIGGTREVPQTFELDQNYPNPFNPSTKIPFRIGSEGSIRITVYNILGQLLDVKEYYLHAGSYTIDWRAKASAGVLFYSMEMAGSRLTRKMVQLDGGNSTGLTNLSMISRSPSYSLPSMDIVDSCKILASSLVFELDSVMVALVDSARADFSLESVHDHAFMIDLHNDVMEVISGSNFTYQLSDRHTVVRNGDPQTDIPRYRDGGVDAQIFSIWIDPTKYASTAYFSTAMKFLDTLKAQAKRNSGDMGLVTQPDSIDAMTLQKKIAGVVVVEGGHCIEDKLENLRAFYNAGVRVMTITWNNSTSWAVSAKDAQAGNKGGLNEFGKQVIRTMDSLGMIIDVSHVGPQTVSDILATTTKLVIASHSGVYKLCGHYRNLTDDQIKAIAQRGGVIGVVFYPPFLVPSGTARVENVLQHIDYIKNLTGGVDCIALGSDFDGIEVTPVGLEDVTKFPAITEGLLQRGYSRQDVRKILGENFMRVFQTVCK